MKPNSSSLNMRGGLPNDASHHLFPPHRWDRVHRIGQTREVKVVRFVSKGTIEAGILRVQERKLALSAGALRKMSAEEMRAMRVNVFASIFDLI